MALALRLVCHTTTAMPVPVARVHRRPGRSGPLPTFPLTAPLPGRRTGTVAASG